MLNSGRKKSHFARQKKNILTLNPPLQVKWSVPNDYYEY